MNTCVRAADLERWFDTGRGPADMPDHLNACADCAQHLKFLETTRTAMRRRAETRTEQPVNADRFLVDLRERIETEPRRLSPKWGLLSAAAAACLVALSLLSIFTPSDNGAVDARSYVESASTEIEGATTETYHSDDGTAIVWVNVPEGDMW